MTLSDAIKFFESRFKSVVPSTRVDEDPMLSLVCSGGELSDVKGVMPALYSSEDLAVEAWLCQVAKKVKLNEGGHTGLNDDGVPPWKAKGLVLEWIYRPELLEFQMTMADRNNSHRLVTKRYAVKSQMRVK